MKKRLIFVLFTGFAFACSNNSTENKSSENNTSENKIPEYNYMEGYTQGTTFHIKYKINGLSIKISEIYSILNDINKSLSIYLDSSIVSRINNNDTTVKTDKYFEDVFFTGERVYKLTDGLFDITVGRLVKAWGFTPGGHNKINPKKISELKSLVGMNKVKIENHKLIKSDSQILIDPNAIAQGYTVEVVSDFLTSKGITDYMIEIGGEVKVKGLNDKGELWKVGIDKPIQETETQYRELETIIAITDNSICTSGSYRKFVEENGIKYSHTINPKTGYPTHHNLLSVTIVTQNCTYADAVATGIMIMGLEEGKKFVENHKEIEAYFIYADKKGTFQTWSSPRLSTMLKTVN